MAEKKAITEEVKLKVRTKAKFRCGYCLASENILYAVLEVDHLLPLSKGGLDDENNLWAACSWCNGHKSAKVSAIDPVTHIRVPLFNPALHVWHEHFTWAEDNAMILGTSPIGRVTVIALEMNNDLPLGTRRR